LPFDFELFEKKENIKKIYGSPAKINRLLYSSKVDIGLISSAEYIQNFNKYLILPDLSISSFKKVHSVVILSNKPLNDVDIIYLTKKSKTSRLLTKILIKEFLKKDVIYKNLENYSDLEKKTVLLIGDNAIRFSLDKKFKYIYDLSELWYRETGLPFVFALWCVNADFYNKNRYEVKQFFNLLKLTKEKFFNQIDELIKPFNNIPKDYIKFYLQSLDYGLDEKHLESLKLFNEYLIKHSLVKEKADFKFIKWF